jgi:signal transduction histidine kinase
MMLNQTSERLKRNAERIMKYWEERACKEIAAASHQESLALRNSLPDYLNQLSDALLTTIDRTQARINADRIESERVGKQHGRERAGSLNYTMDQLIFEYHILRQVICDVLEEEAILTPVEREVIVSSIEQAVNDAANQFSETLRDIQEKLTHTLAHDLRGPITTAKSSAQLILRRPDAIDHCIRLASHISNSMDRLDSMIHDLLDASRIKAGQSLPLHFNECDLDLIARQVAAEANFIYGDRFVVNSNGQCLGYWSEDGIRRVLENLTTNAAKYGAPNSPITLSILRTEDTATITVHNLGIPIPPEEQAILFQQFRRARSADSKTGWGLGLTVVKGIIEAHHGMVRVESEVGHGTLFKIELPRDWRKSKAG